MKGVMVRTSNLGLRLLRAVLLGEDGDGDDSETSEKFVKLNMAQTMGCQIVWLMERKG
jgi:hypothetical protein